MDNWSTYDVYMTASPIISLSLLRMCITKRCNDLKSTFSQRMKAKLTHRPHTIYNTSIIVLHFPPLPFTARFVHNLYRCLLPCASVVSTELVESVNIVLEPVQICSNSSTPFSGQYSL